MSASGRGLGNAFADLALDRAGERREDAAWLASREQSPQARFVVLRPDGGVLVAADRRGLLELDAAARSALAGTVPASFLGSSADGDRFLLAVDEVSALRIAAASDGEFLDLRTIAALLPAYAAGLAAYARSLAHWQGQSRYCGACGASLTLQAGGHRARCTNPSCARDYFPRTDPAILVLVEHDDRCLLGRQPHWPAQRYSALAGFVEPGETLEDAVRREVFEETGVRIGQCTYHASQPWPFPASLMVGFFAVAEDPTLRLGSELAEAHWFTADELIAGLRDDTLAVASPLSLSYRLIAHWLERTAGVSLARLRHTKGARTQAP
jgi:NAD+ diphosphatase